MEDKTVKLKEYKSYSLPSWGLCAGELHRGIQEEILSRIRKHEDLTICHDMYSGIEVPMTIYGDDPHSRETIDVCAVRTDDDGDIFDSIHIEVKVSKSDLNSPNKLSFQGKYNYLCVPDDLIFDALIFLQRHQCYDYVGLIAYKKRRTRRGVFVVVRDCKVSCEWKPGINEYLYIFDKDIWIA